MTEVNRRRFLGTAGAALVTISQAGSAGRAASGSFDKIKVGQWGVGHAHANKLAVYRASADYEVVGIVEPDPQLRQRAEITSCYTAIFLG